MPSFVTPPGIARAAHILRPFSTPYGNVWFADLDFPGGWNPIVGEPQTRFWRFVAVVAPSYHDGSGKPLALIGEPDQGSIIRLAGNHLGRSVLTLEKVSIVSLV